MNRQELLKRLKGHEWTDVEFKEAQQDVPRSAYETVSAFSNTHGGWLVFGVRQTDAGYEIAGTTNVDKVQGDFLSALHADNKENIIKSWQQLLAKYKFFMPKPFRDIDPVTLERRDTPPGFRVFREAAMNLLIHQDYGDHSRKAAIKLFRDGIQFWNPGDVFGDDTRLLEPGEKEVRNPAIAAAMRRITLCEQAGTGFRMMQREWQALGHPAPVMKNDRPHKAFELFIPGLDKEVDMASDLMKAMFGKTAKAPGETTGEVTGEVTRLLACMRGEMTRRELQAALKLRSEENFRQKYLMPALDEGFLEMTIPDKPNSRFQKYRLTEKGASYLKAHPANA